MSIASIQKFEENFINRSLLDSLEAQGNAEPIHPSPQLAVSHSNCGGNTSSTDATGSSRLHQPDGLPSQPYSNTNEIFRSHQPLNLQHQLSQQFQQSAFGSVAFESRSGYDFGTNSPLGGSKVRQQFSSSNPFPQARFSKCQQQSQVHDAYHPLSHSNSISQMPFLNDIRLQSRTPYDLHLQSNGGTAAVLASSARLMGSVGQMNLNVESQSVDSGRPEEISTIFVVGFPDDMQVCAEPFVTSRNF
jgi:hypothetical protein